MRVHFLQHVPYEGLGSLQDWLQRADNQVTATRLYAGDGLPRPDALDLLIVMGGPMGVYDETDYPWLIAEKRFLDAVIAHGTRILGICLGAQLLADRLGAKVRDNGEKEIGWFPVQRSPAAAGTALAAALPGEFMAFHWHGDTFDLPVGAVHLGRSEACENQGFLYQDRILGLQYHLEMTPAGAQDLIDCHREQLGSGPFARTEGELLAADSRFARANALLETLMAAFTHDLQERI
ncbi:type 1 glutamine amidotransferase [Thiohalobacter thiocyanaticus]|uniref:Type 1 glutamine amidotransferase n=1 Tax=Thiohalobacter thiocyanaticus TaxID=585455 RepID=A0A426QIV0_9GAMM|nr:type 1 glutamine amidotransferase [Thiohalobacter thiocyanaticus]RRQ21694.1 type 1 glutamine amidotransferase [Thiohalobacter thiocyanaticus]